MRALFNVGIYHRCPVRGYAVLLDQPAGTRCMACGKVLTETDAESGDRRDREARASAILAQDSVIDYRRRESVHTRETL